MGSRPAAMAARDELLDGGTQDLLQTGGRLAVEALMHGLGRDTDAEVGAHGVRVRKLA